MVASALPSCPSFPSTILGREITWQKRAEGSRPERKRTETIMRLVISLRRPHDASSHTVVWPDPTSYSFCHVRHSRTDNRDHRRAGGGYDSTVNDGGLYRLTSDSRATREAITTLGFNGPHVKGRRGKDGHSSSDGRKKHWNRSLEGAYGTSSDNSRESIVPDITHVRSKRQMVPF